LFLVKNKLIVLPSQYKIAYVTRYFFLREENYRYYVFEYSAEEKYLVGSVLLYNIVFLNFLLKPMRKTYSLLLDIFPLQGKSTNQNIFFLLGNHDNDIFYPTQKHNVYVKTCCRHIYIIHILSLTISIIDK